MTSMNQVMDPQETARTMREFERQNVKMEMSEEMSKLCTVQCSGLCSRWFFYVRQHIVRSAY